MRLPILATIFFASLTTNALADSLLDVYRLAQQKDPTLLQYKAKRDSAYASIDQADAANLPQINLKGSVNYTKSNKDDYTTSLVTGGSLSLQQSIWRHSNFIKSNIAEKTAVNADLLYNDAQQNLIIRTSKAYFGILKAADVLKYAKANKAALKKRYSETNQRYKVGLIANTDVQEAKAAYDSATAQVIIAENDLINSFEDLRRITGVEHKNLNHLDIEKFSTVKLSESSDSYLKTAEENNISLQAKMIEKEIARMNISLAQTGYEPTLDLLGSLNAQHTNYKEEELYKREDYSLNTASIGLELNIPLYSGGATSAEVEVAKNNFIAKSQELESIHRQVQSNLYSQYNNINAAIGTVKAYKQTVVSAKSALDATIAGYQVGTRTIVDVLDATQKYYNAESNLASARYDYIINRLNIKYTTGLLNEDDIILINNGLTDKPMTKEESE
ncbi:MAG: TolC family outer membrane protein [Succinivibrionaceae bacterium]